jgi:hypothetical protein
MDSAIAREMLIPGIRTIYQADPSRAETLIETYLEQVWKGSSAAEKITFLEELVHEFEEAPPRPSPELDLESKEFVRLFSLLFGERISVPELSPSELLDKLALSLNTIFDTLNEIIRVIDHTLLGKKPELETIRHIIGSHLEGEKKVDSLQSYLSRIQEAFLIAHKAFQEAAHVRVAEILKELRPENFESELTGGLKFGPFRKAELFEMYKEKFLKFQKWTESERFKEELLREFERTCQKIYDTERRGKK